MNVLVVVVTILAVAALSTWATRAGTVRSRDTADGRRVTLVSPGLWEHVLVGSLPDGERLVLDVGDPVVARDAFFMLLEGVDPRERLDGVHDHRWDLRARP